jgi:hypothetical protein
MPSQTGRLDGNTYDLSANTFTHTNVDEESVLFVGWSLTPISTILDAGDAGYLSQIVTQVTINDADVSVYAVWGFDRNNDGTPDVLEDTFEIQYEANGGAGSMPSQTGRLDGMTGKTLECVVYWPNLLTVRFRIQIRRHKPIF